ncbi:MAG: NADH-quinone oxidoreductase subunit K [Acidimicrobiia bacterium]|nr:NADH-quinone oxidoreductase subunit K [Acidimicrobiia bacterium]MDX2466693.1 NADH-quinone oxidoreductase subunit K [Acidimicrobiia bacterium]
MSVVTLGVASLLFSVGTYLILQRMLSRVIIGLGLISHGANLLIMLAGSGPAAPPVLTGDGSVAAVADPLPQAMVLTAIVITFGITAFLLALALRSYLLTGTDAVEDDIEDRRIAKSLNREALDDAADKTPEVAV